MSKKVYLIFIIFLTIYLSTTSIKAEAPDNVPALSRIEQLLNIADKLREQAQYDTAFVLIQKAKQKLKNLLESKDSIKTDIFEALGAYYLDIGEYAKCEIYWDSCLNLRQKTLTNENIRVAEILMNLGRLYYEQARYAQGEKLLIRALAILEKNYGDNHFKMAQCYNYLVPYYNINNKFHDAESLTIKALTVFEVSSQKNVKNLAESLSNLAEIFTNLGNFQKADSIYSLSLEKYKQLYGSNHPKTATVMSRMGDLYEEMGLYSQAESLLTTSLDIHEKFFGPNHPSIAIDLKNLVSLYFKIGRYSEMEPAIVRASEIISAKLGASHPEMGSILNSKAALEYVKGNFENTNDLLEKALDNWLAVYGPHHPEVAYLLNNLGTLNTIMGNYEKAEYYEKKGLEARKDNLGPEHPYVAKSLIGIVRILCKQNKYAEAKPYVEEALAIRSKTLGPNHSDVAQCYEFLGLVNFGLCNYQEAALNYEKAYTIYNANLGPLHSNVAHNARILGIIYARSGNYKESNKYFKTLLDLRQQFCKYAFSYSSEEQKLRWTRQFPLIDNNILSLAFKDSTYSTKKLAFEMLLKGKAAVIDALMAEKAMAFYSDDIKVIQNLEKRNEICTNIANLVIAGMKEQQSQYNYDSLQSLFKIKDTLETNLSRMCSDFDRELEYEKTDMTNLARALPEQTVLWEFKKYTPTDFNTILDIPWNTETSRYLAFILTHNGDISLIDLGRASEIDSLINLTRELISVAIDGITTPLGLESEKRLSQVTKQLHARVFAPLADKYKEKTRILISADAALNLLPFEILAINDSQYVIEKYHLSYLTSGRDLLKFTLITNKYSHVVLFADPDFNSDPDSETSSQTPEKTDIKVSSYYDQSIKRSADCLEMEFPPLRYSHDEMASIIKIFTKYKVENISSYYGKNASEKTLKNLTFPPDVLHFSTHGFFCQANESDTAGLKNALLRSGLVLAGANRTIGKKENHPNNEDGILTAFEVSGLNLFGTELAVLSACETGIGETYNGEGVFGLQRAFRHAGVSTLIISLWKIPDKETSDLMVRFYEYRLGGRSNLDAFRLASIDILNQCRKNLGHGNPALWGGFILVGNPN